MTELHSYLNPVHPRTCPDPFVLKYLNEYWCYCTGVWHDGRCFGILHSRDLVNWRELTGAMAPLDETATCYWAPEVSYENGRLFMFYSVGNEERMQIRVAEAAHPAGPFIDSGHRLTQEEFAIDPHVFVDDDGQKYLFYATDFLTHTHIGTGTVCDRMLDWFTLAGSPQPVTRARYDWQVYDPQRKEKGGVRWHTVEGPFVLKHKGHYYQMFSGGNWRQEGYGVSYAVADQILSDKQEEWAQIADGKRVLPIIRTVPYRVIGPGHNSVVRGPDNRQLYCVYHRWAMDGSDRVLAIDPLDWAGERMLVIGPSDTPQPAPTAPISFNYFDQQSEDALAAAGSSDQKLGSGWECVGGDWVAQGGVARQRSSAGEAEAHCRTNTPFFLTEVSLRLISDTGENGWAGIKLHSAENPVLNFGLNSTTGQVAINGKWMEAEGTQWRSSTYPLPSGFDFSAFHLLRVEVNGLCVTITVDEHMIRWQAVLETAPDAIALAAHNASAEFAGFALTGGWEDLFTDPKIGLPPLQWKTTANDARWHLSDQQLWFAGPEGQASILTKGPVPESYELVLSAKLLEPSIPGGGYGFLPALSTDGFSPFLRLDQYESGWALYADQQAERRMFSLPAGFDPYTYQQFRFRKQGGRLAIQHETTTLGEIQAPHNPTSVGLFGYHCVAGFDLVRLTTLGES